MVQSIISISEGKDKILNIIKAQQGFKNKNQTIEFIIEIYADSFLNPELRPEFVKKLNKLQEEETIPFKNINELRKLTSK
ncbi:DUF2683 family protein [Candidatus Pacearchaeota archaeon]|nr:DUF2683 family protein [Candidatus Pacearchaeota archaeon]